MDEEPSGRTQSLRSIEAHDACRSLNKGNAVAENGTPRVDSQHRLTKVPIALRPRILSSSQTPNFRAQLALAQTAHRTIRVRGLYDEGVR